MDISNLKIYFFIAIFLICIKKTKKARIKLCILNFESRYIKTLSLIQRAINRSKNYDEQTLCWRLIASENNFPYFWKTLYLRKCKRNIINLFNDRHYLHLNQTAIYKKQNFSISYLYLISFLRKIFLNLKLTCER